MPHLALCTPAHVAIGCQNLAFFCDGKVILSSRKLPVVQWNVTGGWLNGNVTVLPGIFFDVGSFPRSAILSRWSS